MDINTIQCVKSEQALLGSILIADRKPFYSAIQSSISEKSFTEPSHIDIWQSFIELHKKDKVIDIVSVENELKSIRPNTNFSQLLESMILSVPSSENAGYYIDIVREKELRRKLIHLSQTARYCAINNDLELSESLAEINNMLLGIGETAKEKTIEDAVKNKIESWKNVSNDQGNTGLPPHFNEFRRIFPLFRYGKLYGLCASSGVGKSTMARNLFNYWTGTLRVPCAYISIEMDTEEVVGALMCEDAEVSQYSLDNGIDDNDMSKLRRAISKSDDMIKKPAYINDQITNIDDMEMWCATNVAKYGIKAVILDYVQILEDGRLSRDADGWNKYANKINQLRRIAKKYNIILLALSQVLEKPDSKGGRPKPSDVFGGRVLEHACYGLIFIWKTEDGQYWIDVMKHRCGIQDKIPAKLDYGKFKSVKTEMEYENE